MRRAAVKPSAVLRQAGRLPEMSAGSCNKALCCSKVTSSTDKQPDWGSQLTYDNNNIFARILRGEIPSEQVYEDAHTLVIMDIMPRADGHVLVIPKTPARNMLDASAEQLSACLATVQKVSRGLMAAFDAQGVTLQQFNEAAGGQEVFHLHFHVLPRKQGDKLRAPGKMQDPAVIAQHAEKIRTAMASLS